MKRILCTYILSAALATGTFGGNDGYPVEKQNQPGNSSETVLNGISLTDQDTRVVNSSSAIILSEQEPVRVGGNASLTLVAGRNIFLLPGTKITAGGFLYASIQRPGKKGKAITEECRLVTIEENEQIAEQEALAISTTLSPFVKPEKDHLRNAVPGESTLSISSPSDKGVIQDHHRKFSTRQYQSILPGLPHSEMIARFQVCKGHIAGFSRFVLRL